MTTTTTSPIEVLEKSLEELHEAYNNSVKNIEWYRGEVTKAEKALNVATSNYESRAKETQAIELGRIKHREAIARLKSLEKGSIIVEKHSPPVMDKRNTLSNYLEDKEL